MGSGKNLDLNFLDMLNVFLVHVNFIIFSVKTMHFIDHI